MEDLRFVADLVDKFFQGQAIKKKLTRLHELDITRFEKWLQVEFGLFLAEQESVTNLALEGHYNVDGRKTDRLWAFVDLVFRKKNCAKDSLLCVELKQCTSFATCLSKMIKDLRKTNALKEWEGERLRDCFFLGIHEYKDEEDVIDCVSKKYNLPSRQRVISKSIGRTGYSYTIF